ncbi:MAG TPA: hypothetical protein PLV45_11540 [bacterium]|nr:hypothetical protein [bacterium]
MFNGVTLNGATGGVSGAGIGGVQKSGFQRFMRGLGKVALAAGKTAMRMVPGAEIIETFFNAVNPGSSMDQYGGMTPFEMLGLQQQMLQEARMFTVLSNVMKVRHDAAMNAIRNIR